MNNIANLQAQEGVKKLKELVKEINVCLFCSNLKTDDGATCRPMTAKEVDYQGNLWFFSDVNSDKNKEIKQDRHVQLFFANPAKGSYLVVNGEAEIIIDSNKAKELWVSADKLWFKGGKDDPNLSIIKVNTNSAYYWDTDENKMIDFFKMMVGATMGTNLTNSKEGTIQV